MQHLSLNTELQNRRKVLTLAKMILDSEVVKSFSFPALKVSYHLRLVWVLLAHVVWMTYYKVAERVLAAMAWWMRMTMALLLMRKARRMTLCALMFVTLREM